MRKMKDSGVEWIGKIPEDWEVEKLKYIGASKNETAIYKKGERFIGLEHVDSFNGNIIGQDVDYDECETPIFEKGDFLFSKLRPYLAKGFLAEQRGFCTSELIRIKFNEEQYNKYYKYLLLSHKFIDFVNSMTYGVKMPRTSWQEVREQTLTVPPIQEQVIIANHLDEKCGSINDDIAIIENQLSVLEAYKKSVITEAVTKGLDKNAEMKDSGFPWIGEIPEQWKVLPNKHLMEKVKIIKSKYEGEPILSLTKKGVIVRDLEGGGKFPTSFDGYQILSEGNLLLCLFDYDVTPRTVGKIEQNGLSSPAYSQYVMNNLAVRDYYYYFYLMLDETKELLHLSKNLRSSFNETEFGAIKAPVPSLGEQRQIADYLDKKTQAIDDTIAIKRKQLAVLDEYKKSLIYEYVTGKREV